MEEKPIYANTAPRWVTFRQDQLRPRGMQ